MPCFCLYIGGVEVDVIFLGAAFWSECSQLKGEEEGIQDLFSLGCPKFKMI